nr:MAG TPA: hypothetical protein [Caudoviricetes sp.]
MLYSKKVLVKVFEGETKEQAYLAGCKGIANYVANPGMKIFHIRYILKSRMGNILHSLRFLFLWIFQKISKVIARYVEKRAEHFGEWKVISALSAI